MLNSGLYQLLLYLPEDRTIKVGSKGEYKFTEGYYVYTGSAKKNLQSRISRHISRKKKLHWHIDYLAMQTICLGHISYIKPPFNECCLNQKVLSIEGACIPVKGFGSSDCKCQSHLVYFSSIDSALRIFDIKKQNTTI